MFSRIWLLIKCSFQIWSAAHASRMSAALAYFTMLSVAPLVLIAVAIAGYVFDDQLAEQQVVEQVATFTTPEIAATVAGLIENAKRPATGLLAGSISLVVLFFAASAVFTQLQFTLNQIWQVTPRHKFLNTLLMRLFGVSMVFGVGLSLMASLVLKTMLTTVNGYVDSNYPDSLSWLHFADRGVMYLLVPLILSLLFWLVPMVKIRWVDVLPAALLTAVLFNVSRNGIELYLKFSTTSEVYGAAGSLVVMLIWVYINGLVVFYGAAFSRSWAETFGSRRDRAQRSSRRKAKRDRVSSGSGAKDLAVSAVDESKTSGPAN